MKKLMVMAAMLALMLVAAAPAFTQTAFGERPRRAKHIRSCDFAERGSLHLLSSPPRIERCSRRRGNRDRERR